MLAPFSSRENTLMQSRGYLKCVFNKVGDEGFENVHSWDALLVGEEYQRLECHERRWSWKNIRMRSRKKLAKTARKNFTANWQKPCSMLTLRGRTD